MTATTTVDPATETALREGLRRAGAALPNPGEACHPDLAAVRVELRTLAAAADRAPTLLDGYDMLQPRLETIRENARVAAVAHDEWAARGSEGPDPAAGYARGDLSAAHAALRALYAARATATGVPVDTSYVMYTPEGDAAVHQQVLALAALIAGETLNPRKMVATIQSHIATVAKTHPEVYDTESEWAVVDALNPLLRRAGYAPIGRDDL